MARVRLFDGRTAWAETGYVDAMLAKERRRADLVQEFTLPVPSTVIRELLGVPYADHEFFEEQTRRTITTKPSGYLLRLDGTQYDVAEFQTAVRSGRTWQHAGEYEAALRRGT
ncbi:hypothetical protein [Streptomyces sp. SP17BM10]|uniref:hypothetical protein n=1 Tax=Streptomyces sp. SP17BM10 TaxID=3002530 RepID=UPI003FCD530A